MYSIFSGGKLKQSDITAITNYANAMKGGATTAQAWKNSMGGCSVAAKQYVLDARKAGKSTDEMVAGLKEVPKATTAASVGLKLLSVAGNMLIMMGISMAISGIIKGFQALANAQENAIEKANEFIGKFEEQRDALKSNKETIDSISADYEKLAKGVDSLGRNVSLNSNEYARYNEIVNQIADMFPQMVQGYTDEGNAIITHKGNVEELTKAYQEQKKAAQDAIIVGSADVFKGFKAKVADQKMFWGWENAGLSQLKNFGDDILDNLNNPEELEEVLRGMKAKFTEDFWKYAGIEYGLGDMDLEGQIELIQNNIPKIKSAVGKLSTEINTETAKIKPIIQAYLEQSFEFQGLDEKAQDIVKQIVGQFDSEFYAQFDNETEMATWVTENIVNKFKGKDGKKIAIEFGAMFDLQTKFNEGDITVAEYQEKLTAFLSLIGSLPDETQKAIKLLFGITTNEDGTTSSDVDTMVANVREKFKGKFEKEIGELTLDELEILTNLDISPDGIKDWSEVETLIANAGKEANKMTDSLDSLSSAIKATESAFELFNEVEKDFNSTGSISAENIQKILNKFPELEDELYEYIMGMRTGASVMDLLKTKSDDMATMSIKAFKRMYLSSNSVSQDIKDDYESAFKLIGLEWDNTQSVMANVNTQIVDANGQATQTFVEQWTEACKLAGANVSTFAQGISALLGGDFYDGTSGVYRVQGKGIYYKDGSGMDGKGTNLVNVKAMELLESGQFTSSSHAYKAAYNILSNQMDKSWENQAEFERRQKEFEERMKQYAVTSGDKSSGSNKNEALDNYLKNAENLYKVHQDELKYINDLQWAYDNLTNNDKERLDIESKISEAQRDYADNRIKDIEHENKLLLSQGKTEYNLIDNYRKVQRIAHEETERLRKLGYNEESNEIQELQNQWLEYQSKISEVDFTHSENYIEDRNFYDDWEEYGDSEVKAWKRVLDRFKAEYPNELDKIKEIEKNYFEAKKNQREEYIDDLKAAIDKEREAYEDLIDKQKESLDLEKQRLSSNATLLQSYYNVINSIADEQANIKKELRANLKLYEYTDEATRKLLFNEENYVELSSELNNILGEANRLQSEYKNAIANATLENIEAITNSYERQYELLLKQYEIKKAELEVEKKRQQLNNVLAEKNIQMVIGGKLTWVANTQDVINAQEELADAEVAAAQAIRDKTQTMAIQEIQANEDRLTTIQNNLDKQLEEMNEKWDTLVESLDDPVKDIGTVLAEMAESDVPELQNIINDVASALSSLSKAESVKTVKTVSTTSGAGGKSLWQTYKDQGMPDWLNTAPKDGYASGTLNATKGWHEVEEEGKEILVTKDGKFRNFSGGETVLTADQTDTFMKLINGDFEFPMPYGFPTDMFNGFAPTIPEFKTREIIKSEDHSVNFYGGVTVQECTDVNDFVRQITNGIKRN